MSILLRYIPDSVSYYIPQRREAAPVPISNDAALQEFAAHRDVLERYFSAYLNNILPLDAPALAKIREVVDRKQKGGEIARSWDRLLFQPGIDATHRVVPNQELLMRALRAQFAFDRELINLRKIDRYRVLCHGKLATEVQILKRALTPKKNFWLPAERWSEQEQRFLDRLKEKAVAFGRTPAQQFSSSLQQREALTRGLQDRIARIGSTDLEDIQPILDETEDLQPSQLTDVAVHSSLKDHYVFAMGDLILEPNAKFIIVKRPDKISHEEWHNFLQANPVEDFKARYQEQLNRLEDNQVFHIQHGKWKIEVCAERALSALGSHEDRDFKMKSRRELVSPGVYRRINVNRKDGHLTDAKDRFRVWRTSGWSSRRETTAGPDTHEAIAVNRSMIHHILNGNSHRIEQRVIQNLGEYFDALESNDAASLPGSYNQDPRFIQAKSIQDLIFKEMKYSHSSQTIVPSLEEGARREYSWRDDLGRTGQIVQSLFESYIGWAQNLEAFLAEVRKPEYRAVVDFLGQHFIDRLPALIESLKEFTVGAAPRAIRNLIEQRRPFHPSADREIHFQKISSEWRRGRSPEQIDEILEDTLNRVKVRLKGLTPLLIELAVPFSSIRYQTELGEILRSFPNLDRLYQVAIPPIWTNKTKIKITIEELMKGTELSPLWLAQAETIEEANRELFINEFYRSRLAKQFINSI